MDFSQLKEQLKSIIENIYGTRLELATEKEVYLALGTILRSMMRKIYNEKSFEIKEGKSTPKIVSYLSAEFLLGKQLENALLNLEIRDGTKKTIEELGFDYQKVLDYEPEPSLGNGGLGRLAACYIDSMATTNTHSISYGIRYEYGLFKQVISDKGQKETPDTWLDKQNPWELRHEEKAVKIGFGGKVIYNEDGTKKWEPKSCISAVAYNYLVPGYKGKNANMLRLWKAEPVKPIDLVAFNKGDYEKSLKDELDASTINKILYPEDSTRQGKLLRLKQQYFFTAASIQDLLSYVYKDWKKADLSSIPQRMVFQLNDTHPVIGIPELMRLLLDERKLGWDESWEIVTKTFNYTCHTLLPEALEVWDESIFRELLPRHLEIIYEINFRFLNNIYESKKAELQDLGALSIIQEDPFKGIRMANLASVGGSNVNGVAKLHSDLLKETTLNQFYKIMPDKFKNVTNGISPRRFLLQANSELAELFQEVIGTSWVRNLEELQGLEKFVDDSSFVEKFKKIKRNNKVRYSNWLKENHGIEFNPDTMVDSMIKRIHEYKRQHLRLLELISVYSKFKNGEISLDDITPRTVILAGKAAPGYHIAKEIIKLAVNLSDKINSTKGLNEKLKIIFHPNYNVTGSSFIVPATDLSEQISLAGKEASGTGNMKFALNGALTVGTLDGANVEIRELVGEENFYLFGMKTPEVQELYKNNYKPQEFYESNELLKNSLNLIALGEFSTLTNENFLSLTDNLINRDPFMVLPDFNSYVDVQTKISNDFRDSDTWAKKAILNIARCGFFSSDRSIEDYKKDIWGV